MDILSPRLKVAASYVQAGSVVADIGTDHAYLPIYLVGQGICQRVIGSDLNKGPFQSANQSVKEKNLQNFIDIRLGDGLQVIKPGEADTIVIAGMGGKVIKEILIASPLVLQLARKLILQPMVASGQLRLWLADNGWQITDEELVRDDNRIYEIIVAEPGQEDTDDKLKLQLGPQLLANKPLLLKEHLERLLAVDLEIYNGLLKSNEDVLPKKREIKKRIDFIKKVLECL